MKKRHLIIPLFYFIFSFEVQSQVSSQLIRLHTVATETDMNNTSNPLEGNLIYVQSTDAIYFYDGNSWVLLSSNTTPTSSGWELVGNTVGNSDFIGTTNNSDFRLNTNTLNRMIVTKDGDVGIGLADPLGPFHVRANPKQNFSGFATSNATSTENVSSAQYGPHSPDHATDNIPDSYWHSLAIGQTHFDYWFKIDLGTPTLVNKYRIIPLFHDNSLLPYPDVHYGPTNFEFQASNNNVDWVNIDVQHNDPDWVYSDLIVNTPNTTPYRYYRWFMHRGYFQDLSPNPGVWVAKFIIQEFMLYGFSTNSSNDFLISINGHVGIGTTNPAQKLHVQGNIIASGSITPDYVFEQYFDGESKLKPDYEYKSINDKMAFAKEYKHLPNVSSDKDIEQQVGIIINRAVEQNLEKIEELYLHLYELHQKVNALKEEAKRRGLSE